MKKQPDQPTPAPTPTPDQPTPPDNGGTPTPPPEGGTPPTPPPDEGTPPPPPPPDNGAAPAGNTDDELAKMAAEAEKAAENGEGTVGSEVIEVTGSLVDRKTLDTPAPVTVIDREILKASGLTNVGSIMQTLPANSNGLTVAFNNGGDGTVKVNLRGLGTARTLVLINGRRVVPGGLGADSSVDLNTIPLAMVERVEVLKDGASAIYGSDAIGGVVNVITRNDFKGTEATLYTGATSHGDGNVYDASIVTGASYSKGNVVFSAGYNQQDPIFAGDRDFSRAQYSFDFSNTNSHGTIQGNGSSSTPNGLLLWDDGVDDADAGGGNALWDQLKVDCPSGFCTRDGSNSPYRDFSFDGNSDELNAMGQRAGDLYNFQPENYLTIPLRRYNIFSTGTYKLSDHINAEYEALYVNRKSDQSLAAEPLFFDQYPFGIAHDSIYNPFNRDVFFYRRRVVEAGDRTDKQNVDTFRMVVGLNGEIPEDAPALKNWKWEASFNYGRTQATNAHAGSFILSHLGNAVGPSYYDAMGAPKCGTPTSPGPSDCVPANFLGAAGSLTPEMLKYLTYTGIAFGFNDQKTVLAQAHGQIAKTPWDGDIALALGADYRKETGGFQSDPLAATGDTTTNANEPTSGDYNVGEAFGELSIVPVTNRKAAKYLELDGAFRAYDYSTFGSGVTWKASALYKVPQGISFRGTYSTAFRSPSIADLFSGQSDNFNNVSDPCDTTNGPVTDPTVAHNCFAPVSQGGDGLPMDFQDPQSQLKSKVGGNPKVGPESADVLTAGIVIEPEKVKGFAITFDYYKIKIDNAITSLGEDVILNQCYGQSNRQNCNLISRNPNTQAITLISNLQTNVGGEDSSGIDYAVSYDHDFGGPGRFRFNWEGTYLLTQDLITATGKVFGIGVYDLGAFPRYKNNVGVIWGKGHLGAGANVRMISGFKECDNNDCSKKDDGTLGGVRGVDSNVTGDIFLNFSTKDAMGTTSLAVGVNNVADTPPPFIYNGFYANSDASTYDFMGRFMYVRLSQMF
ncbi:MAG TPA: TonB-dependent receptor [Kofleriaceae bacterium]|nr:TonB-dependent receptor [Kofleriaceae bacterium]